MGGLPTKQPVTAFAADSSTNPVMYAARPDGLWKSADAGTTWRRLTTTPGAAALAVHPQKPDLVVAGTAEGKIVRSGDGGTSWRSAP